MSKKNESNNSGVIMKNARTTKHLKWSEIARLIKGMKESGDRLHLLITIQSLTGLRVGDALRITWRDVLDNTELSITEQKTGKVRRMAISDSLREAVQEEYDRYTLRNDSDFIFLNRWKTKPISVEYVNRQLKSALKKHQVKADQVSSHMFRKSFCYKILEDNNFSDKGIFLVSRLLNHSNVNTTMKYLMLDQREADETYKGLVI